MNLIELVKVLRGHRKKHPIAGLSSEAEALLSVRILASEWYPLEPFVELLRTAHRELLGKSDEAAHRMGVMGGLVALQGAHRAFVLTSDPMASVLAMRHIWRAYFDFGEMRGEPDGPDAVGFTLSGYPDVPAVHGMMIAGWPVAAAELSGRPDAKVDFTDCPWRGARQLAYRVTF